VENQSATFKVPVPLAAGTHQLRVDHYDNLEAAQISLDWTLASSCAAPTATPLPTNTPTAVPTATKIPPTLTPTSPPPTPAPTQPADRIFADGFESGNLSAWTSSITDGGDLKVTTAAALIGGRGMQANINDNTKIYVTNTYPSAYSQYRMRFYLHPNSLVMGDGELFNIYNAYHTNDATNFMLRLRRSSGQYQVQASVRDNSGAWISTAWYILSNSSHYFELDWKAATSSTKSDGYLRLWINGINRTTLTLANSNWRINRERLGAVDAIKNGTRGTIYFDAFESRRTTYIGPAPVESNTLPAPTPTPPPDTGTIFADVYADDWAAPSILAVYNAGITGGCKTDPLSYCPNGLVTRGDMAVFLGRGMRGAGYTPPAAKGIFADVTLSTYFAPWVEQAYLDGVTSGCSTSPLKYCPSALVTRGQMAVFLLKAKYGAAYQPPPAQHIFTDVPVGSMFEPWIEKLAADGITGGCGVNKFCPTSAVSRAQMAVFLTKTFNLPTQ
jgi:hypothetical protein